MRLVEFTSMPLEEALKKLELKDYKVHTNDNGEVQCVELKYGNTKESKSTDKRERCFA